MLATAEKICWQHTFFPERIDELGRARLKLMKKNMQACEKRVATITWSLRNK